jgi:uncharacterized protein with HEPN domain
MPHKQYDESSLWDMLDAALAIREFVQGKTPRDYLSERMLRGAVERHLEIIGEAARRISDDFKNAHPEIPWRKIVGQRNVLAHEYGEILHERIWNVAVHDIPALIEIVSPIIPYKPPEE